MPAVANASRAAFSAQTYEAVAAVLRDTPLRASDRARLVGAFRDVFEADSERFNAERFACAAWAGEFPRLHERAAELAEAA